MSSRATGLRHFSLAGKLAFVLCAFSMVAIAIVLWLDQRLGNPWLAAIVSMILLIPLALWIVRRTLAPVLSMFRALSGTVSSYRDGDFSFSLAWPRNDELSDLVAAHNAIGEALREQRLMLVQRELLVDTMVQNTPVAMLLADSGGKIVYSNLAARKLLNDGRRIEGSALEDLLQRAPEALRDAIERGGDGLFAVGAGMRERRDRCERIVEFVADDADDLLPRLHFLATQLDGEVA
jgi:two-component system nitrogen regulation sensor histidine kinase NtrY